MAFLEKFRAWRKRRYHKRLLTAEQKILKRDKKECARIARAFNLRYVLAARFDTSSNAEVPGDRGEFGLPVYEGNRWMCPSCNRIHAPVRHSFWVGMIYPTCCEYEEGIRHDDLGKLGCLKRPLGWCGMNGLYRKMLAEGLK